MIGVQERAWACAAFSESHVSVLGSHSDLPWPESYWIRPATSAATLPTRRASRQAVFTCTLSLVTAVGLFSFGCSSGAHSPRPQSSHCVNAEDCPASGDACILSLCDEGLCRTTKVSCDFGFSSGLYLCLEGSCVAGVGCVPSVRNGGKCRTSCQMACGDIPCFSGSCAVDGYCHLTPTSCEDADPSTADYCTFESGCVHVPGTTDSLPQKDGG